VAERQLEMTRAVLPFGHVCIYIQNHRKCIKIFYMYIHVFRRCMYMYICVLRRRMYIHTDLLYVYVCFEEYPLVMYVYTYMKMYKDLLYVYICLEETCVYVYT